MSGGQTFVKCGCSHCGNHVEFPLEAAGATVACPHCGEATLLSVPSAEAAAEPASPSAEAWSGDFTGRVPVSPVSALYPLGLALVAVMMMLLVLIYLVLVAGAAYGVFYYATHAHGWFLSPHGRAFPSVLRFILYGGPLVAGLVMVLFMLKPLFAGRAPRAQPLALNPQVEPVLFDFIARICAVVGAPMPARIDVDCQLNASAGFRRGFLSFLGNDLVLTIGLPLLAGLSLREFAGVMAHEFGHFTQGFAMRLSYVIGCINAWFARLVYEPDAWDVWLEDWATDERDPHVVFVVACARSGVWFSRLVLKPFLFAGHAVSCFLLRQMEYHADTYEIKVAGSATFEQTVRRQHVLERALRRAYEALEASWTQNRLLPDNFPAFLLAQEGLLSRTLRAKLDATIGLDGTALFDTHPSAADRIRRARQANEPGLFRSDGPAASLLGSFDILARQVTFLHYTDDLRLPAVPGMLAPLVYGPTTQQRPGPLFGSSDPPRT